MNIKGWEGCINVLSTGNRQPNCIFNKTAVVEAMVERTTVGVVTWQREKNLTILSNNNI